MLQSLAASSPLWDDARVPPESAVSPMYIHMADGWRGGRSRAQWKARLAGPESEGFRQLARMWVVATFARWEGYYRGRIEAAGGASNVDIFGDLCKLRNDIVHNDARASTQRAGRCVILTGHAPGSEIWFDSAELGVIMGAVEDWVHSSEASLNRMPCLGAPRGHDGARRGSSQRCSSNSAGSHSSTAIHSPASSTGLTTRLCQPEATCRHSRSKPGSGRIGR